MASFIDKIINSVNIVDVVSEYVDLNKKGKNYWGVCPFHEDKNPSMSVSLEKRMFKCFVCGKGGSVVNFVSDYEKIPFDKAIEKLAKRAGIAYTSFEKKAQYNEVQKKLIDALKDANNFFMLSLSTSEAQRALEYANSRGLNPLIREKFAIGYSSNKVIEFLRKKGHDDATLINASLLTNFGKPYFKNRLMFGLKNEFGDVIGFSGRILGGEGPKYINSSESTVFTKSSLLYNYNNAEDSIKKTGKIYLNEGFMDVIALGKSDVNNSVAIMGTALTERHISKLTKKDVVLMLDSDEAGINASLKSIFLLLKHNIRTLIINSLGDSKDPDEVFEAKGKEGIKELLDSEISALEFVYEIFKVKLKPSSPETIKTFIDKFRLFLQNANELEIDFYKNKIADDFKISKEIIKLNSIVKKTRVEPKNNTPNYKPPVKKKPIKQSNYTYKLIKSMVKKPHLAKLLTDNNHVELNDPIYLGIVKFLVATISGERAVISQEAKVKLLEINKIENDYAKTESEFLDLINIINKNWKNELKSKIKVKLSNTTSEKETIEYLKQLKKIGKR